MNDHEQRLVRIAGALVIAAGAALALVRFWGMPPPGRDVEAVVGAVAFGAIVAAPGVLAVLALRDRPALLLPAALVLVPLSFISFALVTLPLLVPAYFLLRAYLGATTSGARLRSVGTASAVVAILVAAGVALFARDDPRSYTSANAGYIVSDVVTYAEAGLSLALTSAAVLVGWRLSGFGPGPVELVGHGVDQGHRDE